jgi:hypothetical protein
MGKNISSLWNDAYIVNIIYIIQYRTKILIIMNSLSATLYIAYWFIQPENIKSSRSVQIIKSNLQPQNNTKPIYYYIGTRLGQIFVLCLSLLSFNFSHPVSIYRLLKDTSLVPPVTILAASTWTFSSLLISIW